MTWQLTYNDFGSNPTSGGADWTSLHIDSYQVTPVFESDGISIKTHRHEVSGTALIHGTDAEALKDQWLNAEQKLSRQRRALVFANGANEIVNLEAWDPTNEDLDTGDETEGTPTCAFSVQEIAGAISAIVGFTIVWHKRAVLSTDIGDYDVMSHVWTQSFTFERNGLQTHTVEGRLSVRSDAGVSVSQARVRLGANPDKYRRIVVPDLPSGFVRESMDFATDSEGNTLIYRVVNRETVRGLPGPAKLGTATVQVRQGEDLLVRKSFRGTLEGDTSAAPGAMIAQLVRMSQNIVKYAGAGSDKINSVVFEIDDVFDRNVVKFSVSAINFNPTITSLSSSIGVRIFDNILSGITEFYQEPDPYGSALVRSVKREFYQADRASDYTESTFPIAKTEESDVSVAVSTYTIPVIPTAPDIQHQDGTESPTGDHGRHPYMSITGTEHVSHLPNTLTLPSLTAAGKTRVFQNSKPRVRLKTEYTITRLRKAPERLYLDRPKGSTIVMEDFSVSTGGIDASKNRIFVGRYVRVLDVMDITQTDQWLNESITIGGLGEVTIRRWKPPNNLLAFPFDPRTQTSLTRTIFDDMPEQEDFVMNIDVDPVVIGA